MRTNPSTDQPSPSRLEAFSDGVIAVIITIMVLDFKLPRDPSPAAFAAAIFPTLAVYLLSFTLTGIYWINHHHLVHRLRHVDAPVLYANLFFLFCLSLLPFATSYALNERLSSFSVAVYASENFLAGAGFLLLCIGIARHLKRHDGAAVVQDEWRKSLVSLALYGIALPLAYWHPLVGMAAIALVTPLWIIPGFLIRARQAD